MVFPTVSGFHVSDYPRNFQTRIINMKDLPTPLIWRGTFIIHKLLPHKVHNLLGVTILVRCIPLTPQICCLTGKISLPSLSIYFQLHIVSVALYSQHFRERLEGNIRSTARADDRAWDGLMVRNIRCTVVNNVFES